MNANENNALSWRVQDQSHKGRGWVIVDGSIKHLGAPTIADGLTEEHARLLVSAAVELHGVVAKVAELRRRHPDAPALAEIAALADDGLSVDALVRSVVEKAA